MFISLSQYGNHIQFGGNRGALGLLFNIHYPKIKDGVQPLHRFMNAYEQITETPDSNYRYLVVGFTLR